MSRMGINFDDYPGFQPKITHPKHFCPECILREGHKNSKNYSNLINMMLHTKLFQIKLGYLKKYFLAFSEYTNSRTSDIADFGFLQQSQNRTRF